jgi:N-acetylmuramoyl-L-alanine amidase
MRHHLLAGLQIVCLTACLAANGWAQDKPDDKPDARPKDKPGETAPASSPAAAATGDTCKRATFRIAIDVGHTTEDPGAISAHGNTEYVYNLSLANVVMAQLADAGFRQTTLVLAKGKGYTQLAHRVEIINRVAPDLLLSIHHDSVPTLYLSKWEFAGVERPYSDKFSGHSLFVSVRNRFYKQSVTFAKLIGRELASAGLRFNPQHAEDIPGARHQLIDAELGVYRYDNLVVLKDTHVPAVLFEAGSIINRKEELVVSTPERRSLLAKAIASAALDYCNAHQAGAPPREKRVRPAVAKSNGKRSG